MSALSGTLNRGKSDAFTPFGASDRKATGNDSGSDVYGGSEENSPSDGDDASSLDTKRKFDTVVARGKARAARAMRGPR